MSKQQSYFQENKLTFYTLGSIVVSSAIALCVKSFVKENWSRREILYVQFLGDLYINMATSLIIPLVVSSLVSAVSNLQKFGSGKLGLMVLIYYSVATSLGTILSVFLVRTIKPGSKLSKNSVGFAKPKKSVEVDSALDIVRNVISENLVEACLMQYRTVLQESSNETVPVENREISFKYIKGTNISNLVFLSILIGIALEQTSEKGKKFFALVESTSKTMLYLMNCVITTAPVAIFFLMPPMILEMDDAFATFSSLGLLVLTIFLGVFIQSSIILPLLYFLNTGKSPYAVIKNLGPALITAFGTSSSTTTLPRTIQCLDKLNINKSVSRYMVPIGATINMDGLAMYESTAVIFLTQVRELDLSLYATFVTSATTILSCIGSSGLPNGGFMMLTAILGSLGIPLQDITYIIAIDFLADRFRGTLTVVTDSLGAAIVSHHLEKTL